MSSLSLLFRVFEKRWGNKEIAKEQGLKPLYMAAKIMFLSCSKRLDHRPNAQGLADRLGVSIA